MSESRDVSLDAAVARVGDIDSVLAILDEASAWLAHRGIRQWPARFRAEVVRPAIEAEETWLFRIDGEPAGTITADDVDPVWSDADGSALYLHRLAVRRRHAGLGERIIGWAEDRARQLGREFLRGDCLASNAQLLAYYARLGFHQRGSALVGGSPGQRLANGRQTDVIRIAKAVPPEGRRS